jgi:hypothetical protein
MTSAPFVWVAGAAPADDGAPPDFALYAGEHLVLAEGARVRGGAVGVASTLRATEEGREFRVEILGARVDGDVYGDSVRLGPGSRVGDVYTDLLSETRARKGRVLPLPAELPALAPVARNAAGLDEIIVASRGRATLGPSHTRVTVGPGATLVLPGGRFDLELLQLDEGSRLEVERPSVLAISRRLTVGPRARVGPAGGSGAMNLTILVGGADGVAPATVLVEDGAELRALVLAPTGRVRLGEGVRVLGALQGRTIEIGPRTDISYVPGLVRPSTDFQCIRLDCDAVAGGQIDCHPEPAVGVACNDGNQCTENDACNGEGQCAGQLIPDPDPDGVNPCVRDTCHPVDGIYEPKGTACVADLGLDCVESQWCNGQGLCSEMQLLPDGTACDDGIPDNGADQCFGGGCVAANYCQVNTCGGDPSDPNNPTDLACWLDTHSEFKKLISWYMDGGYVRYSLWPPERKQELKDAFEAAWRWLASGQTGFQGTPLPEPLPNEKPLTDLDPPITGFSETNARGLYLAHVGHSLALEIRGDLPWSLCDHLPTAYDILSAPIGHYGFLNPVTPGGPPLFQPRAGVTPAHPTVTYAFLTANGLIGSTRFETIGKLLDWSRRLAHFFGPVTTINMEGHWQYRGAPPVSRTIGGTVATPTNAPGFSQFGHWTRGCWGTMGFLKNVLMSANIPVIEKSVPDPACIHATPYFPSEGGYLSHGDDPYGFFREGTTTIVPPIGAFLIDEATYTQWFTGATEYVCSNISRQDAQLALALLPDSLALKYCDDVQHDKDHASGLVYQAFSSYYTVQELEAADLWTRLSQRATDLGLWCGGL